MIEVNNIRKTYGDTVALDAVTLSVGKGELFGLIGPDGAGKTSLFRILTTLLLPEGGSATVNHHDVVKDYKKIRKEAGYMPGNFSLYQDLSVEENLQFFASIFHTDIQTNFEIIRSIYEPLAPFKNRRAGALSGGMKQKLALCCSLIHNPPVLFLDEPTTGVDALSRQEFWETLHELKKKGVTILVSTPYMDEASLCDRIAMIQAGHLIGIGTPAEIISGFTKPLWSVSGMDIYRLLKDLQDFQQTDSCSLFGNNIHVTLKNGVADVSALKGYLLRKGHETASINPVAPVIEDCFIERMKE
jgi:ABC-type multidrug transport system ATPase subunit